MSRDTTAIRGVGISLLVLAAALYFGRSAPQSVVIGLVAIIACLVIAYSPQGATMLLIPTALLVRFGLGTGTGTQLNAVTLLVPVLIGIGLIRALALGLSLEPVPRAAIPLLALNVVALISFVNGSEPWLPLAKLAPVAAQLGALAVFALSTSALLLVHYTIREVLWLRRLTLLFLILGVGNVISRSVPYSVARPYLEFVGPGVEGSLFWTWIISLAFSQAAFNRDLPLLARLGLAGVLAGSLYVGLVMQRDWTSGWFPGFVAIAGAIVIRSVRGAMLVFLIGSAAVIYRLRGVIQAIYIGDNEYSLGTRLDAWSIMFQIIGLNPLLGLGPANYYWYTPLFPIRGYAVVFNSHNNYLDILAQVGILGFACFLLFAWLIGRAAWRLRTKAKPGFERAYVYGVFGGLLGTLTAGMLGDWILPFVYNIGIQGMRSSLIGWIFLGGLLALERIVNERTDVDADASRSGSVPFHA
ncbi:MAG: O-antigen ligase family protein [Chloroflexota bacterium]